MAEKKGNAMQTIVFINPLKEGKFKEYKAFSEHNIGPGKKEYNAFLKKLGLHDARVFHHTINGKEYIVVMHEAEDDSLDRISHLANSKDPYDRWFMEQLYKLHDFDGSDTQCREMFTFKVK